VRIQTDFLAGIEGRDMDRYEEAIRQYVTRAVGNTYRCATDNKNKFEFEHWRPG
jgi:hypothetical protein